MLLGTGYWIPIVIHFDDGSAFNPVFTLGFFDRMGHKKRHPDSGDLGGMDGITADLGGRIDDRCHPGAGLQHLIADNDADIARTDHQNGIARSDAVNVGHGLGGTGADNPRQRPAGKGDHVLGSPGGHQCLFGFYLFNSVANHDIQGPVFIDSQHNGI